MEIVYVESSVISYITARPSRDVIVSARQALSLECWDPKRNQYEVYISELVIEEIASGDPSAAQKRLDVVKNIISLEVTVEAKELAGLLLSEGAVPENSPEESCKIQCLTLLYFDTDIHGQRNRQNPYFIYIYPYCE